MHRIIFVAHINPILEVSIMKLRTMWCFKRKKKKKKKLGDKGGTTPLLEGLAEPILPKNMRPPPFIAEGWSSGHPT
jgi:hypothetical protein